MEGRDPILTAIDNGDIEKIRQIPDVNVEIEDGKVKTTPLIYASYVGNLEIIKLLLDRGADINKANEVGQTPLITASARDNIEIIKLLLDNRANINITDIGGSSVLLYFVSYGKDLRIFDLLLKAGANIDLADQNGNDIVSYIYDQRRTDVFLDLLKILISNGLDINRPRESLSDGFGRPLNLLQYSVLNENIPIIKFLLEKGANPFVYYDGKTLIDTCASGECKELIAKYTWDKLRKRDEDTARKYSEQTSFPKDIWEVILLNKRRELLCTKLNSERNKEILRVFALELEIPITEDMTKAQLCADIAKQINRGRYSEKDKEYYSRKAEDIEKKIRDIAFQYGLNTNKPVKELLKELSLINL